MSSDEQEQELRNLRRWKREATELFSGLQDLGRALDLPLGVLVTGATAIEAANALRAERDDLLARRTTPNETPLREAVEALTFASDDGTEYEHNGHADWEGEPECPGCWAASIRAVLDATDTERTEET